MRNRRQEASVSPHGRSWRAPSRTPPADWPPPLLTCRGVCCRPGSSGSPQVEEAEGDNIVRLGQKAGCCRTGLPKPSRLPGGDAADLLYSGNQSATRPVNRSVVRFLTRESSSEGSQANRWVLTPSVVNTASSLGRNTAFSEHTQHTLINNNRTRSFLSCSCVSAIFFNRR